MKYLFITFIIFFTACSNTNTVTEYYPNGTVRFTGIKKDGYKTGTWDYFNETGKMVAKETYKTDTLQSKIEFLQSGYLQYDYKNNKACQIQSYSIQNGDSLLNFIKYNEDSIVFNSFDSNNNLTMTRTQYFGKFLSNSKKIKFEKGKLVYSEIQRLVKDSIVETTKCEYMPEKECSSYFYDYKTGETLSKLP
jgi:hypothetical protein